MKKISLGIVALSLVFASCNGGKNTKVSVVDFAGFESVNDSLSYFIGSDMYNGISKNGLGKHIQEGVFIQGFRDAKSGAKLAVTLEEGRGIAMSIMKNAKGDTTNDKGTFTIDYTGLNTSDDSLSYFIGSDMYTNLNNNGIAQEITENAFLKGMEDAYNGDSLLVNAKVGNAIAMKYVEKVRAEQAVKAQQESLPKIAAGETFLNAKSAEKDVVTLPSGLRYKILKKGTGALPTTANTVKTHYHGTLMDGTVFDSSVDRGEPIEFPVTGVISGWTEALQLMPVGSKWELYLPYNLAYGERAAGPKIGPYETLIFEVELLDIVK